MNAMLSGKYFWNQPNSPTKIIFLFERGICLYELFAFIAFSRDGDVLPALIPAV